jgi:hypothetical protein
VFGNGKTAAKVFVGKYVTTTNTVNEWLFYSPIGALNFVSSVNRPWNDRGGLGIDGDYVPQCDFPEPRRQWRMRCVVEPELRQAGRCRTSLSTRTPRAAGTSASTAGTSRRASPSRSRPRVSVEVDYIRRSWGNLQTDLQQALTPSDFDKFTYTVPVDPKLPGGGGYSLTLFDVKPAKFGISQYYQTFSNDAGGAYNRFNGWT